MDALSDGARRQTASVYLAVDHKDQCFGHASGCQVMKYFLVFRDFAEPSCIGRQRHEDGFDAISAENIAKANMHKSLRGKCHDI